jgi:hypothetical protein
VTEHPSSRALENRPGHPLEHTERRFMFVLKSQCVTTKWSDKFAEPTAGCWRVRTSLAADNPVLGQGSLEVSVLPGEARTVSLP